MFNPTDLPPILAAAKHAKRFWIAFSGGLDSHVLLHALANVIAKDKLYAIHINHGWNRNAEQWAEHCQQVCTNLAIHCEVITVDAKPKAGESPEAYARTARYAAFAAIMLPGDCLLTAHQQDDQAETILLQMLRGAGINGLASMPVITDFAQGQHLRPLLNFTRAELEEYAQQQQLQWIEDDSNLNTRYDRNYIRHALLPQIKQRWPAATLTLARVAKNCAEAKNLLAIQAEQDLINVQGSQPNTLSVRALLSLDTARWHNVVRHWLQQLHLAIPSDAHIEQIHSAILTSKITACPKVTWEQVEVRRYRDDIYAFLQRSKHDHQQILHWDLTQPLQIAGIGTLTAELALNQGISQHALKNAKITVRFRQNGERCQPYKRTGSHPLKKLMQEWHIPPWERDRIPLIYCNDNLAAVVNYCTCKDFVVPAGEMGWIFSLQTI